MSKSGEASWFCFLFSLGWVEPKFSERQSVCELKEYRDEKKAAQLVNIEDTYAFNVFDDGSETD